jgi:hypothetical protein
MSVEVEESLLIEASRLRFSFFQSRKLWSDRFVGYATVNLHVSLSQPIPDMCECCHVPLYATGETALDTHGAMKRKCVCPHVP